MALSSTSCFLSPHPLYYSIKKTQSMEKKHPLIILLLTSVGIWLYAILLFVVDISEEDIFLFLFKTNWAITFFYCPNILTFDFQRKSTMKFISQMDRDPNCLTTMTFPQACSLWIFWSLSHCCPHHFISKPSSICLWALHSPDLSSVSLLNCLTSWVLLLLMGLIPKLSHQPSSPQISSYKLYLFSRF